MPRISRLFVMLCMAVVLVYAGASTSQVINQIQHSPAQVTAHDHDIFSDAGAIAMQTDHHDDDAGEDQSSEHLAGGHHHHGDTGPSLMVSVSDPIESLALAESLRAPLKVRQVAGVDEPGPERPPRQAVQIA